MTERQKEKRPITAVWRKQERGALKVFTYFGRRWESLSLTFRKNIPAGNYCTTDNISQQIPA